MFQLNKPALTKQILKLLTNKKERIIASKCVESRRLMYSEEICSHPQSSQTEVVDLRSDTVTKPNPEMRQAMFKADVGDDVMGEDPTINELEAKAASLLGKDAALFVPSGTMGNLIAIMVHCNQRGSEIIVGDSTHIFKYEQGSAAHVAGVQLCTLQNKPDGTFDLNAVESHIRGDDDHEPITALVCVENTHNLCGGKALPIEWLDKLAQITKTRNIPMHMDGARLFNASVYQNIAPSRIVRDFASVSFCLSKGLGAPVGSLLVGTDQFIKRARRTRKALGGGMRQAGILAAAGLVAIGENMVDRLTKDHATAMKIAKAIDDTKSKTVTVDIKSLHTNILLVNVEKMKAQDFCQRLSVVTENEKIALGTKAAIVKAFPKSDSCVRLVTHADLTDEQVNAAIQKMKFIIEECEN